MYHIALKNSELTVGNTNIEQKMHIQSNEENKTSRQWIKGLDYQPFGFILYLLTGNSKTSSIVNSYYVVHWC